MRNYRWAFPKDGDTPLDPAKPEHADVRFTLDEHGDYAEPAATHEVTLDTIARGLSRIRSAKARPEDAVPYWSGTPTTVRYLSAETRKAILRAEREDDAGAIDAGLADVIVQVGLLGEVRYG